MKYMVYIDRDYSKYSPLIKISEVNFFEINLKKFKILFIYVDNVNEFYNKYRLFPRNCIFVLDRNIYLHNEHDFEIIYKNYELDEDYSFKDKVIRYTFLKDYLRNV